MVYSMANSHWENLANYSFFVLLIKSKLHSQCPLMENLQLVIKNEEPPSHDVSTGTSESSGQIWLDYSENWTISKGIPSFGSSEKMASER